MKNSSSKKLQPTDPEAKVLEQLQKFGSNLSKLHPVEFFFYFPTKENAESVKLELTMKGFSAQVGSAAYEGQWCCMATQEMIPEHYALVALRDEFTALAQEHNGEYDGWGTPVVE